MIFSLSQALEKLVENRKVLEKNLNNGFFWRMFVFWSGKQIPMSSLRTDKWHGGDKKNQIKKRRVSSHISVTYRFLSWIFFRFFSMFSSQAKGFLSHICHFVTCLSFCHMSIICFTCFFYSMSNMSIFFVKLETYNKVFCLNLDNFAKELKINF